MTICEHRCETVMSGGILGNVTRSAHRYSDLEGSFPVPSRVQNFIRGLFCEEIQLNKLGIIEHKLDLQGRHMAELARPDLRPR